MDDKMSNKTRKSVLYHSSGMDKISYLTLFQTYSTVMTSDSQIGSQLREMINLDKIWNGLSDQDKEEMREIFSEIVSKITNEVIRKRNRSFKAFQKGMKKK